MIDRKTARTTNPYNGCQPLKGESRFLAEAWTRIGEHHFDRGELEPAIYAYSQVLPFTDSPYFDKALYKLAWSYYRADRFAEAVRRFDELVVLADKKRLGDAAEKREGSSLRGESIQYLALSFAERDWDGDGKDRQPMQACCAAGALLRAVARQEPHVREVLDAAWVTFWFDRTEYRSRRPRSYQVRAIDRLRRLSADNPRAAAARGRLSFDRLRSCSNRRCGRAKPWPANYAAGQPMVRSRTAAMRSAIGDRRYRAGRCKSLLNASAPTATTQRAGAAPEARWRNRRIAKLLGQARVPSIAQGRRVVRERFCKQHPAAKTRLRIQLSTWPSRTTTAGTMPRRRQRTRAFETPTAAASTWKSRPGAVKVCRSTWRCRRSRVRPRSGGPRQAGRGYRSGRSTMSAGNAHPTRCRPCPWSARRSPAPVQPLERAR